MLGDESLAFSGHDVSRAGDGSVRETRDLYTFYCRSIGET